MGLKSRVKPPPALSIHKNLHERNKRTPIIIYTYSPKPIQTDENNFMWVVQRMTGSRTTQMRCEQTSPLALDNVSHINCSESCSMIRHHSHPHRPAPTASGIVSEPMLVLGSDYFQTASEFEALVACDPTTSMSPQCPEQAISYYESDIHEASEVIQAIPSSQRFPSPNSAMTEHQYHAQENPPVLLSPSEQSGKSPNILWQESDWRCCRLSTDNIQSPGSLAYQEMAFALLLSQQTG